MKNNKLLFAILGTAGLAVPATIATTLFVIYQVNANKLKDISAQYDFYKAEKEELLTTITALEKELNEVSSQVSYILEDLKIKLVDLNNINKIICDELEIEFNENDDITSVISEIKKNLILLNETNASLFEELSEKLSQAEIEITNLNNQIIDLNGQIADLEDEVASQSEMITSLNSEIEDLEEQLQIMKENSDYVITLKGGTATAEDTVLFKPVTQTGLIYSDWVMLRDFKSEGYDFESLKKNHPTLNFNINNLALNIYDNENLNLGGNSWGKSQQVYKTELTNFEKQQKITLAENANTKFTSDVKKDVTFGLKGSGNWNVNYHINEFDRNWLDIPNAVTTYAGYWQYRQSDKLWHGISPLETDVMTTDEVMTELINGGLNHPEWKIVHSRPSVSKSITANLGLETRMEGTQFQMRYWVDIKAFDGKKISISLSMKGAGILLWSAKKDKN
ncbi:hypothetical protein [Mesoplasma photuris]|uniref:hypothetical protein n=1 Tax=Mesoplasma photuris TaxID=217731 RepID=UPI0004E2233A|nr:hypothetical protein [Mesoplasma photuris]